MTRAAISTKAVLGAGAALLALWAASFALSYVPLGAAALPVAMAIALVKASLVGLVFMELVRARASIVIAVLAALTLTAALIGFMIADIATRDPAPVVLPAAR